jgi:hypothetical protein
MNRTVWLRFARVFLLLVAFEALLAAQTTPEEQEANAVVNRGQQIAAAVSTVTSVAVSPLLGVCLLGAWDYFRTAQDQRTRLPFYDLPVFWIPVGILLILIFIKDTVGGFNPLIKKPLDAIEVLLLNKAALVIIGFPVLFHQIEAIAGVNSFRGLFSALEPVVYAAGPPSDLVSKAGDITLNIISILAGSAALVVVWLVGHSIDVLLLLSPFPFLDVPLKGFRVAVFAALVGTSAINRTAGLAFSLVVILICAICVGWAFRLAVFGTIFAWDLLRTMLLALKRVPEADRGIQCFAVGRRLGVRKRTFGRLGVSPDGKLEFRYRRMAFGPWRRVTLSGAVRYQIGRGLLHPSLIGTEAGSDRYRILFRMLPGYRGSEDLLREALGLDEVRDIRIPHGLRALWRWLNDSGEEPATPAEANSAS